jgi:hypothetical protein
MLENIGQGCAYEEFNEIVAHWPNSPFHSLLLELFFYFWRVLTSVVSCHVH